MSTEAWLNSSRLLKVAYTNSKSDIHDKWICFFCLNILYTYNQLSAGYLQQVNKVTLYCSRHEFCWGVSFVELKDEKILKESWRALVRKYLAEAHYKPGMCDKYHWGGSIVATEDLSQDTDTACQYTWEHYTFQRWFLQFSTLFIFIFWLMEWYNACRANTILNTD